MRKITTYCGAAGEMGVMVTNDSVWFVVGEERTFSSRVAQLELSHDEVARLAADLIDWLSTRP
jgi:hypothetical protein